MTTFFTAQVMKESLRLYSPLPIRYREAVAYVELDRGNVLPAGTRIIVTAYLTHRNPQYFPDPDRFLPEISGWSTTLCLYSVRTWAKVMCRALLRHDGIEDSLICSFEKILCMRC